MNKNEIADQLQALRIAATRYDWRQCEVSVFKLFPQLSIAEGMRIAIEQLAGHLGTFEQYHPDIKWVRQWFDRVKSLKPVADGHDFPFHSETRLYNAQGLATPGSTAFMDGITLFQEAFDAFIDDPDSLLCLDLVKGVIGSSVTAKTFAYAADTCPEAWEDARVLLGDMRITEEYSLDELEQRNQRRGAYDVCTNNFQKGLWLAIADQLQQHVA